jgi:hypothetical protein
MTTPTDSRWPNAARQRSNSASALIQRPPPVARRAWPSSTRRVCSSVSSIQRSKTLVWFSRWSAVSVVVVMNDAVTITSNSLPPCILEPREQTMKINAWIQMGC